MPLPTGRAALVALALAVARLALPDGLAGGPLLPLGLLAGIVVLDALLAPAPGRIEVGRALPATVTAGVEAVVTWTVRNPAGRPATVALADDLGPSLGPATRRATWTVPAGGSRSASTTIRPTRRGSVDLRTVTVRTVGPLGVGARQATRYLPARLRVLPAFPGRREADLRIRRAAQEAGLRAARLVGGGTEFDHLRDWTPDDDHRRIDWSATARRGHPVVRAHRSDRNQQVVVLLDSGRVMARRVRDEPRLEEAIDATLVLTAVATGIGDRAGVVVFDREVRAALPPARDHDRLRRVTELLHDVEPVLSESDYRGVFVDVLGRLRRRTLLVVVTDLLEHVVEDALLPALPIVAARHRVLIGAVDDPAVARWAAEPPAADADPGDVHRHAAAVAALEDRRRTAARLRSAGAAVVDAAPGRLGATLADEYLRAKATGRL